MLAPKPGTELDDGQVAIADFYRLLAKSVPDLPTDRTDVRYEIALQKLLGSCDIGVRGVCRQSKGGIIYLCYWSGVDEKYHWGAREAVDQFTVQWLEDWIAIEFESIDLVYLPSARLKLLARYQSGRGVS